MGQQRLARVQLFAALEARVSAVSGKVSTLQVVLPGVFVAHHLGAELAGVASSRPVLFKEGVGQVLHRRDDTRLVPFLA